MRKYIIKALLLNIDRMATGQMLLCGGDLLLYNTVRRGWPHMRLECLREAHLPEFVKAVEVPEVDRYDYILDMGLLTAYNWDARLIRAIGFHLKERDGQLRAAFPIGGCIPDYYTAVNKGYRNWLGLFCCNGVDENGGCVSAENWKSSAEGYPWYVVYFCSFEHNKAWLQSFYTEELRWELCCGMNRIEYDIEPETNARHLVELVVEHQVDGKYLARLLAMAVIHKDKVKRVLERAGMSFNGAKGTE